MKVLLVQPNAHVQGHYFQFAYRLCSELQQGGDDASLLVWQAPEFDPPADVPPVAVNAAADEAPAWLPGRLRRLMAKAETGVSRLLLTLFTVRHARRLFEDGGYDAMHILDWEYSALLPFSWPEERFGRPVLNVIESNFEKHKASFASRVRWVANEWVFRRVFSARGVLHGITHADEVASELERSGRVAAGRLTVVPLPVERAEAAESKSRARARLGLASDKPVLLFFGVMRDDKGLDRMVDALAGVPDDFHCVIAGADRGGLADVLQGKIEAHGLGGRVELRVGYVPESDIPAYFIACDVVLLPYSSSFNQASSVLAIALGHLRPAIVTNAGQMGRLVNEWGVGEAAATESVADLRAAIQSFLAWDEPKREATRNSLLTFAAQFSWQAIAQQHRAVYDRSRPSAPASGSRASMTSRPGPATVTE